MLDVAQITTLQRTMVERWHSQEVFNPHRDLLHLVCEQHKFNFLLWHEEDIARQPRRRRRKNRGGQTSDRRLILHDGDIRATPGSRRIAHETRHMARSARLATHYCDYWSYCGNSSPRVSGANGISTSPITKAIAVNAIGVPSVFI